MPPLLSRDDSNRSPSGLRSQELEQPGRLLLHGGRVGEGGEGLDDQGGRVAVPLEVPGGLDKAVDQQGGGSGMMARRIREYGELWEGAAAKLRDSSYRSEDLLDDWFRFWGKAVRDMTAGPALLWGMGRGDREP